MIKNPQIKKSLFEMEKIILYIISAVLVINLSVNYLAVTFTEQDANIYLLKLLVSYPAFFGFLYLLVYAISQPVTSIPFLVSLNCPKKRLAKTIIYESLNRSLLITIVFTIVKIAVFQLDQSMIFSVFGLNIVSNTPANILFMMAVYFILAVLIYSLFMLISLSGVRFGWIQAVTIILFLLGSILLFFNQLFLVIVFGRGLSVFLIIFVLLSCIFSFINYKLIKNFENKY